MYNILKGGAVVNVSINQIEAFLTAAEHLNLSNAADSLYLSHAAISKMITRLEQNIGYKLFIRKNNGVALTQEGESLYQTIREPFMVIKKSFFSTDKRDSNNSSILKIGVPDTYNYNPTYGLIKRTIESFSKIDIKTEIVEMMYENSMLLNALLTREAEIIIGQSFIINKLPEIEIVKLGELSCFIVISSKHSLAANDTISFSQLTNENLYVVINGDRTYAEKSVEKMLQDIEYSPKSVRFVPNSNSLLHAVNNGHGIAFFPKVNKTSGYDSLKFYPFPKSHNGNKATDRARIDILAAWNEKQLTPHGKQFLNVLQETARNTRELR